MVHIYTGHMRYKYIPDIYGTHMFGTYMEHIYTEYMRTNVYIRTTHICLTYISYILNLIISYLIGTYD